MRWLRLRALLLANLGLFFAFLVGLALTGHAQQNAELTDHGRPPQTLTQYLGSSSFGEAVFENWESEFLQMFSYVLLTAYLVQKGSAESRPLDEPAPQDEDPRDHRGDREAPWPVRRGSELILTLYENSLAIAFGLAFLVSIWLHAATGAAAYSQDQELHASPAVTTWQYIGTPRQAAERRSVAFGRASAGTPGTYGTGCGGDWGEWRDRARHGGGVRSARRPSGDAGSG
ncbi:DUF6766 family protein [Kribbella sp. NPDC000426]|uniref:DUF6766 family protein n=1 Tax=Kribbella sp. NPDC000426 TaxID=3154255 RepID=UPI00332AE68A